MSTIPIILAILILAALISASSTVVQGFKALIDTIDYYKQKHHHQPAKFPKTLVTIVSILFVLTLILGYAALAALVNTFAPTSITISQKTTPTASSTSATSPITNTPFTPTATDTPTPSLTPTPVTTAMLTPSPNLLYKEDFATNSSSWTAGGYTVGSADNSIVCTNGDVTTPCSGVVNYIPTNADYTMILTVRFTTTSFVGTGNVLCLSERTNDSFPQGVKVGIDALGDLYNGCINMSDSNYIGHIYINLIKEFTVKIGLNGSNLSVLVSQQGNDFPFKTAVVDTNPGKISIIAYYPVVVNNVSIYA